MLSRTIMIGVLALAVSLLAAPLAAQTPTTSEPASQLPTQPPPQPVTESAEEEEEETAPAEAQPAQPMVEALRTSSKLFGFHIAKPSAGENDILLQQFFKKNILDNRENFGALVEAIANNLEQDTPVEGKAELAKAFATRASKFLRWLQSYKTEKDLTAEVLDFCQLYIRLRVLAHADPAAAAENQKNATALDKDINDYVARYPKQAWGQLLLALMRDLAMRGGFKTAQDKSPEEYLSQASALAPREAQIHFVIGNLFRDYLDRREISNFLKQLATEFEKCLLLQRKNKELFAEVTAVYVEIHEMLQKREAQEPFWFEELVYRRIIALDPSNASAHNNLSFLYSQYGVNLKDALREAQIANQLKPNDPLLLDTLGWAFYKNGQMDKAIETLRQAAQLNKDIADVHFHLATVYYDLNDVENASREFRETLRLEPDNAFARNNLAYLFAEKDVHLDEALILVDEALEKQPDNAAFLDTKGWIYYKLGKHEQAIEFLKKAVELSPETSELHLHLGKVYLTVRDFEKAVKSFESALQYDPENTKIARELAYLFALNGLRDSLDRYSKIGGVSTNKENFKVFYDAMAAAATSAGDYDNAIRSLQEYIRFTPRPVSIGEQIPTTDGGTPIHEQLAALGAKLPAGIDLLLSVERPGLAKLATYFAKQIAERYGLSIPHMTGYEDIPLRLVLALEYLSPKRGTDFLVVLELPEKVFDVYFEKLDQLKAQGQEITLPIGNITVPFNLSSTEYKGVPLRSVTLPQGVVHFVLDRPYSVFSLDRSALTSLVDRIHVKDKGLSGVESWQRFAIRQKKLSDLVLFLPFEKKEAPEKLPEPYKKTFSNVQAFGAAYTVVTSDELTEDSLFIPKPAASAPAVLESLQALVGTVQKDIAERLSKEIRLEAKFSQEEGIVIGESRLYGFGRLVADVLGNWYKSYLPNLDLTPNSVPREGPPEEESPVPPED